MANSRPSDCIAAHYKIVPIKIADKLAIKIIYSCVNNHSCMNIIFNSLLAQLFKYDIHTTHNIKSIHAIFNHILLLHVGVKG